MDYYITNGGTVAVLLDDEGVQVNAINVQPGDPNLARYLAVAAGRVATFTEIDEPETGTKA